MLPCFGPPPPTPSDRSALAEFALPLVVSHRPLRFRLPLLSRVCSTPPLRSSPRMPLGMTAAAPCSKPWIAAGGAADQRRILQPGCRSFRPGFSSWRGVSLVRCSDRHSGNGFSGCAEENDRIVQWFRQAWPYMKTHRGSTFVIVISGDIVNSPRLDSILQDISILHGLGIKFVIVPGTHVQIDKLLKGRGSTGKYVGQYQITDSISLEAAMEASGSIQMTIQAKLSPGPPKLSFCRHGDGDCWHELGVCAIGGNFLAAKRRGVVDGIDFGFTGEVKKIDDQRIQEYLNNECIVIMSNLGYSSAGEVLSCNTHEVATACALAIKADKLIFITDGRILDEQDRLIPFMTLHDADMLIRKHAIQSVAANYVQVVDEDCIFHPSFIDSREDGNLSWNEKGSTRRYNATFQNGVGFDNGNGLWFEKQGFPIGGQEHSSRLAGSLSVLAAAVYVCRGGVQRVHIIDGTIDGALLLELFTRDGVGTMVASDVYEGTRSASAADLPGIRRVIEPLEKSGILVQRTNEELLEQLDSFVVVERDGSIIACAALIPFFNENCGEVAAVAVSAECRGQGQGDKLLDFIEKKASSLGLEKLFLLTTRAADWFVRRGFTECSIESIPQERRKRIDFSRGSKYYTKKLQMEKGAITLKQTCSRS